MKKFYLFWIIGLFISSLSSFAQSTGYADNFNSGSLASGWYGSGQYALSVINGELKTVVKGKTFFDVYGFNLPSTINIAANPYVSIKIRGFEPKPFKLGIYVVDNNGNNVVISKSIQVPEKSEEITFNFKGQLGKNNVDSTKIVRVMFVYNPQYTSSGTYFLDELRIGDQARVLPNIYALADQSVAINAPSQNIQLRGIDDGTNGTHSISISASSSNTSLIPNPVVNYSSPSATGSLQFRPNSNASGQATITVRISANGATDRLETFTITVLPNAAPVIDTPGDQVAGQNKLKTVNLTGIDDGNPEATQSISITATSSNQAVVPNPSVNYTSDNPFGSLSFTPSSTGTSTITVTVKDNGGTVAGGADIKIISFNVTVYGAINAEPTIVAIPNQSLLVNAGATNITLTGISDGDNSNQNLSFSAFSSNPSVIGNPTISYSQGSSTATLTYTPLTVGQDTISVVLTDAGGASNNNGNKSTTIKFAVTVNVVPRTGFIEDFSEPSLVGSGWGTESYQTLTLANGELKNVVVGKQGFPNFDGGAFAGFTYEIANVPSIKLLDVSANPFISLKLKATAANNFVIYLWDEKNNYVAAPGVAVPGGGDYVEYYFSWYGAGKLSPDGGKTFVDATKIIRLLLNINPGAPYDGTVYLKDLRVGDQANGRVITQPNVTFTRLGDQSLFSNSPAQLVQIKSISPGFGSTQTVSLHASSLNTTLVPSVTVSGVSNGVATLNYTIASNQTGKAGIVLTATAPGSTSFVDTFYVNVTALSSDQAASISIISDTTYQTINGFGSANLSKWDLVVNEIGLTIDREILFGDDFEPVNDNSDASVINRNGFKKSAIPTEKVKSAQAAGIKKFIVSIYTPPAWMKKNFSSIAPTSYGDDANDRLDPAYYDEFAELMAAYVKIWKEQTGIDLYAISIQNELQFEEFYGGALYSPEEYKNTLIAVGRRFRKEGISTKLFGPENLYFQGGPADWINAINADPEAKQYLDIVAVHYTESANDWSNAHMVATKIPVKELWVTEAGSGGGENSVATNWDEALSAANSLYNGLNYQYGQVNGWIYWDFQTLIDKSGTPYPGYYVTQNFTKFIRPGAIQVKTRSSNSNVSVVAFKNPDNTIALVMINNSDMVVEYKINGSNLPSSFHAYLSAENLPFGQKEDFITLGGVALLPPKSVTTLISNTDEAGSGLRAYYFNNQTLSGTPALTRIDPTVNFNFGDDTSPAAGINATGYSVRWLGQVKAPVSGAYTFSTESDDGIRLWVNGVQVINNWTLHGPTTNNGTSINLNAGQKYDIRLEYFENTGNAISRLSWSYPGKSQQIVPQQNLFPAPLVQMGNGTGLSATYYNNIDFTGSTISRTDATVNFNWGGGSPDPAIGSDTFSARWTGKVQAQYSESYTFYTVSDDGIRLYVNGQLIINNWTDHAPTENTSVTIDLIAGQKYDITLEFFENGGGAVSTLSWSSNSQYKVIIPQSQLYPTGQAAASDLVQSALVAYPNPTASQLNLKVTAKKEQVSRVQIHDLQSKLAHDQTFNVVTGDNVLSLPVKHLKPGMHLVSVMVDGKRIVKKIIIIAE